jgi:two-component sensor histidine kinase
VRICRKLDGVALAIELAARRVEAYGLRVPSSISVSPAELLLLREMTHRIKNELTSTIGYISLLAARSTNCAAKLALAEVIENLHDHAALYQELQIPAEDCLINATAYLRALCRAIARAKLENSGIELYASVR